MALEDIIKAIGDETERAQFSTIAAKYAPVKQYLEIGEQVQPVFEKLTTMGLPAAAEIARAADWAEYREKHWLGNRRDTNNPHGMWDTAAAAIDEASALRTQVAQLEEKAGTEMTADQIEAYLKTKGFLQREDIKDVIDGPKLNGAFNAQARRFQEVNAALESKAFEFYEKYKAPLPRAEVFDYMEKHGERDVMKAYAEVIKPLEHGAEVARLKADALAAKEAGKQEGIAEAQSRINAQRMPVDGGGGQQRGAGHFMSRIFQKRTASTAQGNGRLGTGSSAQAGFADYQKAKIGQAAV